MITTRALGVFSLLLAVSVALTACPKKADEPVNNKKAPVKKKEPASQPVAKKAPMPKVAPIQVKDAGFATPESVLYDAKADVYLVANINGAPLDKDGNGFISKVAPDGKVIALKWIEGDEKKKIALDAPKGMALTADTLWVADIDHVRKFDRQSGAPKGAVKIPKATFVNDLVAAPDGTIYASDSGLDKAFKGTGTDAIWKISGDKATVVIKDKALGNPNGLALDGDELVVVTFGSGEMYRIKDGKKVGAVKAPKGSLDGIERLADGSFLVSSWAGQLVYKVDAKGAKFEPVVEKLQAPADIGYDSGRSRLLVPLFKDNAVVLHPL